MESSYDSIRSLVSRSFLVISSCSNLPPFAKFYRGGSTIKRKMQEDSYWKIVFTFDRIRMIARPDSMNIGKFTIATAKHGSLHTPDNVIFRGYGVCSREVESLLENSIARFAMINEGWEEWIDTDR